jgi:hypothetical protein
MRSSFGSLLVVAGLLVAAVGCGSCSFEEKDDFFCGVHGDDGNATYCDRQNEKCVCATSRCARPLSPGDSRCDSGFEYRLEPGGCVEAVHLRSMLERNDNQTFCPQELGEPPPCGEGGDAGTCGATGFCLCGVKEGATPVDGRARRCVRRADPSECALGFEYASNSDCVTGPTSASDLILRSSEDPLCPAFELWPRRCGVPGALGNQDCAAGQYCLCGVQPEVSATLGVAPFTCVRPSTRCLLDGGAPGLEDRDGTCVGVAPASLVLLVDAGAACPGAGPIDVALEDAGTDTADAGVVGGSASVSEEGQ